MLARFVSVVGGMTLPFLLYAALAVVLGPPRPEGWPRASRRRLIASATGLTAGAVFAALRATSVIISRTAVNIPTLVACVITDVVMLAVLVALVVRPFRGWEGRFAPVANAVACLTLALAFFRAVPETILQLTAFIEPGEAIFTSDMLLRVLGFLCAWAAIAVFAFIYYRACRRSPVILTRITVVVFGLLFVVAHITALASLLHATHCVQFHGRAFRVVVWLTNNSEGLLLLLTAAVLLVPMLVAFAATLRRVPEQPNPARLRHEVAERRRSRRWVLASALGFGALVATRTVAVAKVNEVPTLSPPEPYEIADGNAVVALADISDGHLHRFAYDASGTEVRFITILKNGGAYGVGLDACENCGPAGYFEKNGKIICKRCDVAINPATIGFKGGCNPIPIDFTVDGGSLMVPTSALDQSAKIFA